MTTTPTVSISSVQQLALCVPYLLGFRPERSVVLLGVEGPRVGPTLRADLPAAVDRRRLVDESLRSLARHCAAIVGVLYGPRGRCGPLRTAIIDRAPAYGLEVIDVVLADDLIGHELDADTRDRLAAECAAHGRAVLESRDALAESVRGPDGDALDRALNRYPARLAGIVTAVEARDEPASLRRQQLRIGREVLAVAEERWHPRRGIDLDTALDLAAATNQHVLVRDALISDLLSLSDQDRGHWRDILHSVVVLLPDELAVELLTVYAILAYRNGDGALARCALDRVERTDPEHRLTALINRMLGAGMAPAELSAMAEDMGIDAVAAMADSELDRHRETR